MGITTAAEADVYDNVKNTRVRFSAFLKYRLLTKNSINRPWNSPHKSQQKSYRLVRESTPVNTGSYTVPCLRLFQMRKLESLRPEPSLQLDANLVGVMSIYCLNQWLTFPTAQPLNLANSASLDLLSSEEQSLCSTLRVLPKPYLTIKELYIRENERRQGLLRRRDARKMLNIDVNKSGRIFDFLVQSGMLVLAYEPQGKGKASLQAAAAAVAHGAASGMTTIDGQSQGKDMLMERVNGLGMTNGLNKPITHEIRLNG